MRGGKERVEAAGDDGENELIVALCRQAPALIFLLVNPWPP